MPSVLALVITGTWVLLVTIELDLPNVLVVSEIKHNHWTATSMLVTDVGDKVNPLSPNISVTNIDKFSSNLLVASFFL